MPQSVHVVSFLSVALGDSVRTDKSVLGTVHCHYPFTSREEDSENVYEVIAFCNPAAMVISSASPAAKTQSHTESQRDTVIMSSQWEERHQVLQA